MTLKLNGTNSEAAPAYAGDDADTGLQCGTNELKLVTGGTARATVDSSGNLGIGVAAPACGLHVDNPSNSAITQILDTDNSAVKIIFRNNTETGNNVQIGADGSALVAFTNGSERMRILSSGGLTFNGDTAAANALDDYEEGTFTPTINTGFTASYNSQTGRYTKVGNVVHFFISIDLSSLSGSSSDTYAEVEGLPFTATSTGNIDNAVTVAWQYQLGNSVYHAYIEQNATSIVLLGEPANGTRTHWNPAQVWDDADGRIALSGTYTTTA